MKHMIILKGERNTGKSTILKGELPGLLDMVSGKRVLYYRSKKILLIVRAIHESADWEGVLQKIDTYNSDIVIMASWSDQVVHKSKYLPMTADMALQMDCRNQFDIYAFCTERHLHQTDIAQHHQAIARQIKSCIDKIIDHL